MLIKAKRHLSENTIQEVLDLEELCIDYDNLRGSIFLDSSLNVHPGINSFFLLYEKEKLISILTMFVPTKQEAEIAAYTLPKYREKGYFKLLLTKAMEELKRFEVPYILFVCERSSIPGKEVMKALQAGYEHTEYFMRFLKGKFSRLNGYRIVLRQALPEELEEVVTVHMKVFNDNYDESKSLIQNRFHSDTRDQYLAILQDKVIGVVSTNYDGEDVSIFGLGIIPEYQGKGYGKELLCSVIDRLLLAGKAHITIEVNSDNTNAYMLYKKTGFYVDVAYEYYRMNIRERIGNE
ncbi:acetyltransferase [Desulfosporosinus orientis DSM 765]|uniref:Acetyltransferase n=1 Tax=Desulfosporosinus orientis (strain ATCC 19365 / DSM 765 / NCIMB 8382 / VKM B-1628 / Singapore I) TaxID=768706 RepID=G7WAD9_DESOD|nr:GNAT family N-acetyltransferase [Desulfosporosinus orientis]AET66488.1 acetyltransferase [Desulfosporosinus orientis DSM 765]